MRRITVLVMSLALLAISAPNAGADGDDNNQQVSGTDLGAIVRVQGLVANGWGGSPEAGRGGTLPCFGTEVNAELAGQFLKLDPTTVKPEDRWVVVTCYVDALFASWIEAVYRVGDPAIVALLRQRAEDYLVVPLPVPALKPPPNVDHLVGIPEYLAIDAAGFAPISATAAIPGVSVTVTATPVETRWTLGNGDTKTCSGAGIPWSTNVSAHACTYTYQRSSTTPAAPDGTFTVTASTVWQRTWVCTPACGSGALPLLARPTSFPLTVRQAQAVITG